MEPPLVVNAARIAAAQALARRRWGKLLPLWVGVRTAEVFSNAFLLGVALWIVAPRLLVLPFLLLWYLPAAVRTGSAIEPLRYPLLLFVVDDHSMIGFHPLQRDARAYYFVQVLRVQLLILAVVHCTEWSPVANLSLLPETLKAPLENQRALEAFRNTAFLADWWGALGATAVFIALVYQLALTVMLLLPRSPLDAPRDDIALRDISRIASAVQEASLKPEEDCFSAMRGMTMTVPGFRLPGLVETFMPSFSATIHVFVELHNAFALAMYGEFSMACLLVVAVVLTVLYRFRATRGEPHRMLLTAWESWKRGMFTDEYWLCIRGDQGVQALPALVLKIYSLPFACQGWFAFGNAVFSVISTTFGVAQFMFVEYDLGVEMDGALSDFASKLQ